MKTTPMKQIKYLREFIRFKAANRGLNLTQMMAKVAEKYDRKPDVNNYSGKIRRGTLSVLELFEILDIIGVEIEYKDRS
ncbi:MAG: hypothetical protein KH301_01095 [Brachyspira sp.]|uniref:hypothetical protein n=1 Tax=Candidatus Scatousia sp. TaxID=3085663 RepID=UPI0040260F15|nr:hypothetical protein [Brachyspira sp.]